MFQKNISLRSLNTFGIESLALSFIRIEKIDDLIKIVTVHKDLFILSGGSNILLTQNIKKPVVHLANKGIELLKTFPDKNKVLIKAQSGENWHEFVMWCISKNYGGIENLSLIPGNVGTSPMQNIGAYGVEIKDVFHELEALEISTGKIKKFNKIDCAFGYRESVFKNHLKGKYIILNVTFELHSSNHPINDEYGAIKSQLRTKQISNPTIKDISEAVINIRKTKLPDPNEIGNSGSFFKNPVISAEHFKDLKKTNPEIPHYLISSTAIKVPAGWLVEQCGFKGKRFGDAGVHKNQALVLVNYKNASGIEILNLAKKIQTSVKMKFDINLEMEVNII